MSGTYTDFRVVEEVLRRFFMEEEGADFTEAIAALGRIEEQLTATQRLAEDRAYYIHEQAARMDALQDQLEKERRYANEGWVWLGEALDALGAKTVFDIKKRAEHAAQVAQTVSPKVLGR